MENQQTNTVLPEVIFFANKVVKGNNLGGGFIKAGGIQIRFGVFINDKFSQGFNVSLPIRKNTRDNTIVKEVEFITKETEQYIYNQIAPKISHLLGTMPKQPSQQAAGGYQKAPEQSFQQGFAPQQAAAEEPRVIGTQSEPVSEESKAGSVVGW